MVVRLNLFKLEVDPVVLDQSLDNTGTSFTGGLLLLVKGSGNGVFGVLDSVLRLTNSFIGVGGNGSTGGLSLVLYVFTCRRGRRVPADGFVQVGTGSGGALVDESFDLVGGILNGILGSADEFVGVGRCSRGSLIDIALGLPRSILGSVSVFVRIGGRGGPRG